MKKIKPCTGNSLRSYMLNNQLTVEEIAKALGLSVWTIERNLAREKEQIKNGVIFAMALKALEENEKPKAITGKGVELFRQEHSLTRTQLSELLGVRRENIFHYENKKKNKAPFPFVLDLALKHLDKEMGK
jgi:transcriptional regulator with XRE-family HTH domain